MAVQSDPPRRNALGYDLEEVWSERCDSARAYPRPLQTSVEWWNSCPSIPSASNEPTIPDPPVGGVGPDSLAAKEEQAVNSKSEDLLNAWQGKAKTNAIRRDEWLRHCFFGAVAVIILFGGVLLMVGMAVWSDPHHGTN